MKPIAYISAVVLWGILLIAFPPHGSDNAIYTHNAELTLSGQPAFGRAWQVGDGDYGVSPNHPAYLDYTGLQHAVYVVLTALPGGYAIYTLLLLIVTLWLLARFSQRAAFIAAFLPPLMYFVVIVSWEDKLPFLVLPLLVLWLLREPKSQHSSLV